MFGSATCSEPESVVLLQAEDTLDIMQPNMAAAGAELYRIFALDPASNGPERPLMLPDDFSIVVQEIEARKAGLLVIDPVAAFFGVNLSSDMAVRRVTQPLVSLAERLQIAIVLVRHLRQSGTSSPIHRGSVSMSLAGAARSGLLVAPDPTAPERRILAQYKSSWAVTMPSLAFRIVTRNDRRAIEWLGESRLTDRDLLATSGNLSGPELDQAIYVLYSILGDGPVLAIEAKRRAAAAGVADRTLRRAKDVLGVESKRQGYGPGSKFYWIAPSESEIVRRLRERDLDDLWEKLVHGDTSPNAVFSNDNSTRKHKSDTDGRNRSDHDEGTAPSSP